VYGPEGDRFVAKQDGISHGKLVIATFVLSRQPVERWQFVSSARRWELPVPGIRHDAGSTLGVPPRSKETER
jgi:hypothetical protein